MFKAYYFVVRGLSMMPGNTLVLASLDASMDNLRIVFPSEIVETAGRLEIHEGFKIDDVTTYDLQPLVVNGEAYQHTPALIKEQLALMFFTEGKMTKFIRVVGFNQTEDEHIFLFTENAFHDRTAKVVTRGIERRARTAGFVKWVVGSSLTFAIGGRSETLNVASQYYDFDQYYDLNGNEPYPCRLYSDRRVLLHQYFQ